MKKLVLFDIDKTLIKRSDAHISAFSEALKKVYGINSGIDVINYDGLTDQLIIIEVLKKNGLDDDTIKLKLKDCTKAMVDSFNKIVDNDPIILLDGAKELLEELRKNNVLLGLVTGSLEPIAKSKLKKVSVDSYFKLGGFGSDDMDRTNLIKIAIKKAEDNFDFKFSDNVFLVGDTPRDIKAGKEAMVKTIGVATGIYSKEDLEKSGADFVLENLKDKNRFLEIIYGSYKKENLAKGF